MYVDEKFNNHQLFLCRSVFASDFTFLGNYFSGMTNMDAASAAVGVKCLFVYYLRRILHNMKAKSSSRKERFVLPDVCQSRSRHIGKFVHAAEREIIFRPNCSKFAAECD